jgi:hypothetical protein
VVKSVSVTVAAGQRLLAIASGEITTNHHGGDEGWRDGGRLLGTRAKISGAGIDTFAYNPGMFGDDAVNFAEGTMLLHMHLSNY